MLVPKDALCRVLGYFEPQGIGFSGRGLLERHVADTTGLCSTNECSVAVGHWLGR